MRKDYIGFAIALLFVFTMSSKATAQQAVQKTNNMKVYMHYMPWFETPETIGKWGWHWTMNNKRPDKVLDNGQREIAAHYYPLIGPYASRDKEVIEYHLLLMKLSGIDGVLINWYGVQGSNADIKPLLESANAIVDNVGDFGMEFGVILEDRFSRTVEDVKANLTYLKNNYFNKPDYIRYGDDKAPLVGIFGPITFEKPSQWTEILPSAGEDIEFLTLWNESGDAGSNADGEYLWIYQNYMDHLTHLDNYYKNKAPQMKTVMGVVYPGFHDYYAEGNAGEGYFYIPHDNGNTLNQTLQKIEQYKSSIDLVQLATWNDYGEGTIFEPTVETGFNYLKQIQTYTGVNYGEKELKLVYRLYQLRKHYASDAGVQHQLDLASAHLVNLEINKAAEMLNGLDLVTGLQGNLKGKDKGKLHVFPNPFSTGNLSVNFEGSNARTAKLSVIDLYGKRIYEQVLAKGTSNVSIPRNNFIDGVYFVTLQKGDEVMSTKVIVN